MISYIYLIIIRNVHGRVIVKKNAPNIVEAAKLISNYIGDPEVFEVQFFKVVP